MRKDLSRFALAIAAVAAACAPTDARVETAPRTSPDRSDTPTPPPSPSPTGPDPSVALMAPAPVAVQDQARAPSPAATDAIAAPPRSATGAPPAPPAPTATAPAASPSVAERGGVSLIAVGDIAWCEGDGDERTAALVSTMEGTIVTLGDNAYPDGTAADFRCYDASWGPFLERTRPSPGNHDWRTPSGYFGYFGARAGDPSRGHYSFDLGSWHLIALNSNCALIGGCGPTSPQTLWLRTDLARSRSTCTLAYWHHPVFSSEGSLKQMAHVFRVLYDAGVDVVLNGHDHWYEHFAPQDPDGRIDSARGVRQIIVGTGGRSIVPQQRPVGTASLTIGHDFGVLQMTLLPGTYEWRFVPVAGASFTDSGAGSCH